MKIAVLTGKLGGYSAMQPMLRLIEKDPDLELCLIVCDQHLEERFGYTEDVVRRDFPAHHKVFMGKKTDSGADRAASFAILNLKLPGIFEQEKPDVLLLFGDRGESLIAANIALHMGIKIGHIQAGDETGGIDDKIRQGISSLSDLFFNSHGRPEHRRIFVVGDLHIDPIKEESNRPAPYAEMRAELGLSAEDRPIVIHYHPDTNSVETAAQEMNNILFAIPPTGYKIIALYPCNDPGFSSILRMLKNHQDTFKIKVIPYLDPPLYRALLRSATFLIGNSSAGVIEAPYLGCPSISVGPRQVGRLSSGDTIFCDTDLDSIRTAIAEIDRTEVTTNIPWEDLPYGTGNAGRKIIEILKEELARC